MSKETGRKQRFSNIRNFALYYGQGREEELACFDLAVVEPQGQNRQSVRRLREAGALVLAYLSVMEAPPWAREFKALKKEDFLQDNGEIMMNQAWGTYLVDLCSPRWRKLLDNRAGELLGRGYYGLFLDKDFDLEFIALPGRRRNRLAMAAVEFMRAVREAFPHHLIVQNNGLESIYRLTAHLVDGFCWENPPFGRSESAAWVAGMMERLRRLQQEKAGMKVLVLLEDKETAAVEMARHASVENGFILYVAPCGYTGGVIKPSPRS